MRVYPSEVTGDLVDDAPDYLNDDYYKTSYSKAEIRAYLKRVKDCIKAGRFIVLNNDGGDREGCQKKKHGGKGHGGKGVLSCLPQVRRL